MVAEQRITQSGKLAIEHGIEHGIKRKNERENNSQVQYQIETMLVSAVVAMLLALGILLFVVALLEIKIGAGNSTMLVSIYFVMSGVIWGMLILRK